MLRFTIIFFAFTFVIIINYLSNALPFNNQTTSEIANRITVLFTPAGYVFSIWGLIYLLLIVWVLRSLIKQRRDLPLYKKTTSLFVLSCFLNSFWLFLWHYEYFLLSVVVMVSLLLSLIFLYKVTKQHSESVMDWLPFSIYVGWISVATIANISYALVNYNWDGFGLSDVFWTITMLIIASALALFVRIYEKDFFFPLVFVWAFIGIGVNTIDKAPIVSFVAFILATVIFIGTLFGNKKQLIISYIR
ncbi:tryptophan-rich sensory protein [Anaerobacillus alkaliphilus]|uniref:Tryptophan-rich sensory protein n=1 Tax=Anaerobacillus alkaliphilus TaxID=1548597 RepID=A0A4Q0VS02_9BACI|nr:TspO/MBR family protein [Anaerobacillus alkaliphilus]RXJ00380.1 tryptophan-rich sensory protein [Anaerobacillus alkaliphilus]